MGNNYLRCPYGTNNCYSMSNGKIYKHFDGEKIGMSKRTIDLELVHNGELDLQPVRLKDFRRLGNAEPLPEKGDCTLLSAGGHILGITIDTKTYVDDSWI